jgi:hypothetical protein
MKHLILILLSVSAHAEDRPFWTEKTSYIEGDRVYFVGVSSSNKTLEDGRLKALNHAKAEALQYVGAEVWPEAIGLNTQVSFEERRPDGFRCFRLTYVDLEELKVWRTSNAHETIALSEPINAPAPRSVKQSCSGKAVKRQGKTVLSVACQPNTDGPAKDALINELTSGGLPYMLHHCASTPIVNINAGEQEDFVVNCI